VENAGRNETSVQPGYAVRPASERDIEAVVGLFERQEIGDHGRVTADWGHIVPFLFRSPGFNPAADARTMESEGSPVAFTGVFREDAEGLEPFMSWIVADPACSIGMSRTPRSAVHARFGISRIATTRRIVSCS
jgi:hypothetical protein